MDRQMKRYFATVFALFMILGCLSACSNGKEDNGETTGPIGHPVEAEVTTAADTADYDSNGGIILSSTTDRYVYRTPDGYLAITFNDRTALQVLIIREYETAEAASKVYMDEYAVSGADGETYARVELSGKYLVFMATPLTDNVGKIFSMLRTDIITEYGKKYELMPFASSSDTTATEN